MGSTGFHEADELASHPPAALTPKGLAMLTEIWEAMGRPAKPPVDEDNDGTICLMVAVERIASHRGGQRRSAAQVRAHLMAGGYLHMEEFNDDEGGGPSFITELGLSAKGFDALIEARVIPTEVK